MRPPAQGQWNPEQHHRWSPRQEGGDSGPEETGPWSPGLGILQPASACSLSQERGGSGFDAIGSVRCPRPCRTENCAQRRAATVAAGARTSPGLCYSDTNLFCYCAEQDNRSLACLFFKSFYYRDVQINSLSLRVLVVFPSFAHRSLQVPPMSPHGHPASSGALSSAAPDTSALLQAPPPKSCCITAIKRRVYYETWRPSPPVTRCAGATAGAEALGLHSPGRDCNTLPSQRPQPRDQGGCEGT